MTAIELLAKIQQKMAKTHAPVTFAEIMEWTGYEREITRTLIKKLRSSGAINKNDFGYYVPEPVKGLKPEDPSPPATSPLIPFDTHPDYVPPVSKNIQESPKTPIKKRFTFGTFISKFLDSTAFFIAITIELVIISVAMYVISPGFIERIAMIGVGFIIVLFSAHAFVKGSWHVIIWVLFALVSFWIDVSFALLITDIQTEKAHTTISIEDDILLKQLRTQAESYEKQIKDLDIQFTDSRRGTTVDSILYQVTELRKQLQTTNTRIADRITQLNADTQKATVAVHNNAVLSADGIFLAIPKAISKGRIIQTIIFMIIFAGLEVTIISSIYTIVKRNKDRELKPRRGKRKIT